MSDLFGLHFLERHENVIFCGPVAWVNRSWPRPSAMLLAALVYRVLFSRADLLLKTQARSRADNSFDRELRRFLSPDLHGGYQCQEFLGQENF